MQQTNGLNTTTDREKIDPHDEKSISMDQIEYELDVLKDEIEHTQLYTCIPRVLVDVEKIEKKILSEKNKNRKKIEKRKNSIENLKEEQNSINKHENENKYNTLKRKKIGSKDYNTVIEDIKTKLKLAEHYYTMAIQFPLEKLLKNTSEVKTIEEIEFAKEEKRFIKLYKKYKKLRKKKNISGEYKINNNTKNNEYENKLYKFMYNRVITELKNKEYIIYEDRSIKIYKLEKNSNYTCNPTTIVTDTETTVHLVENYNKLFEKAKASLSAVKLVHPQSRKNNIVHSSFHNTLSKINGEVARLYTPLDLSGIKTMKKMEKKL